MGKILTYQDKINHLSDIQLTSFIDHMISYYIHLEEFEKCAKLRDLINSNFKDVTKLNLIISMYWKNIFGAYLDFLYNQE